MGIIVEGLWYFLHHQTLRLFEEKITVLLKRLITEWGLLAPLRITFHSFVYPLLPFKPIACTRTISRLSFESDKKMFKLIENLVNKDKVVTLYHNNISRTKERTYLLSLVSFSKNLNSWYTTKFGCSSAIFCHPMSFLFAISESILLDLNHIFLPM